MKNNIKKNIKLASVLAVTSLMVVTGVVMADPWVGPFMGAPLGNIAPPLNQTAATQSKIGTLVVGALASRGTNILEKKLVLGIPLASLGLITDYKTLDVSGDINFTGDLYKNGTLFKSGKFVDGTNTADAVYMNGNVGIGIINPTSKLEIDGDIGIKWGGFLRTNVTSHSSRNILRVAAENGVGDYVDLFVPGDGQPENNRVMRLVQNGNVGIGTTNPKAQLHLKGDGKIRLEGGTTGQFWDINTWNNGVLGFEYAGAANIYFNVDGTMRAKGYFNGSDRNLKKNIKTLENSLDKIIKLRGVEYNWKDNSVSEGKQIGVIAQEVEEVFPELVGGKEGGKTVMYSNLVAPLIEAVKEQQKQINNLKEEIENLKK